MSTVTPPPYDLLDLDPFSTISVDLRNTPNEKAVWGVGTKGLTLGRFTIACFAWPGLSLSDTYGIVFNQKKEPKAGETAVATAVASVDAFSTQYFLTIDEDQVPKGESEMYLRVNRRSGQESRSNTLNVLFKTTLPGGYDLRYWEPWHSELKLIIEGLPEGSLIDASIVDAGVWCLIEKYEHFRLNDTITIVWAGVYFTHIVGPDDIARPKDFRIEVPAAVIAKANQFGPVFVGFTVEDVVGNEAGGKYKYSKPYALRMQLDPKKYEPPIFRVNTEEVSQVDFDTPGPLKFDVKPTLPAFKPAPNPRNMVTVNLIISLKDQPDETLSLPAVADRNQRGEPIDIPRDIVAKAVGGQLLIWVEVTSASGKVQKSGYTQVFVVGTPTTMPAPKVTPIEGTLIPSDFDIAVEIPEYNPHNSAWWETLHVHQGSSGGGGLVHTQKRQAGPQGGVRDLSKVDLKQFDGKGPFSIFYSTNNGKGLPSSIRESEVLTVEIGSRIVDLPPPLIKFAEDGNIDPKNVKRSILQMSFPYMAANIGNILHWNVVGADSESSDSGIIPIDAALAGPLLTEVEVGLKPEVLRNNIGGAIICSYSVETVASATEPQSFLRSELATFTVGPQVVLELPKVLEADKDFQDQLHPKDALNGVTVRAGIKPMLAGDIITVGWAGAFGISKTEVQVQGDPSKPYVDAHIPPEIIALAIRDTGNNITVSYRFTRGQITYKSQPLRLRLLPVTALPAPTLNKVKGMVFPLFALGDEARIDVDPWILIQKGQRKFLEARGTFADGKPYLETIYFADKVTADEVAQGVSVLADVDSLKKLKDGSVLSLDFGVSYAQRDEPDTQVPFGRTEYRIQAIPASLPAPAFDNQVGPALTIAPLAYVQGATVVVTYTGMTTLQSIDCQWIFPDGSLAALGKQNGVSGGRVVFTISPHIMAASVGKRITLRYLVTTGTKTISSQTQTLTVETIAAEHFPQALINGIADKGVVKMAGFTGNATSTLSNWPFSVEGQRVWITAHSAGIEQLPVLTAYKVTPADVTKGLVNIPVSRAWLERLGTNSTVRLEVAVTLDRSDIQENAIAFKSTTYTVLPQFWIAQEPMVLNGISIKVPSWARTGRESVGNTATRVAINGSGTLTYTSRNAGVASVSPHGVVTGNGWGSTIIDVKDQAGNAVQYPVNVSNVYSLAINETLTAFPAAQTWINTGRPLGFDGISDLQRVYGSRLPVIRHYWIGPADPGRAHFYHYMNIGIYLGGINNHRFGAWTLVRLNG